MAGIMDMFSGVFGGSAPVAASAPQAPQQQQQSTPGNIPANAGQVEGSNNQIPAGGLPDTSIKEPAPMADFADLWKPSENQAPTDKSFLGAIDPAKVMEAARGTDFTKMISPEIMGKISQGGPEAMQAMMTAMNSVTQAAFAQSAITSAKMVEQALAKAETRFSADLPNKFKQLNVSENMRNSNPVFSNPAVAPIISAVEFQLGQKYPQASASEITKMAQQYVTDFGNAVIPKTEDPQAARSKNEPDWSSFLS